MTSRKPQDEFLEKESSSCEARGSKNRSGGADGARLEKRPIHSVPHGTKQDRPEEHRNGGDHRRKSPVFLG
jgi:hypothetical protein